MKVFGSKRSIQNFISLEYQCLSDSDKSAAETLAKLGHYRQACYFLLQAIEKTVRAKIFTLVDGNNKYFRDKNRTHSISDAIDFLIEIISKNDPVIAAQHKYNFYSYVLGSLNYQQIHNNLRYPWFSEGKNSFYVLDIHERDYAELSDNLKKLETYLKDFY